jgi:hypothetical protein
MYIAIEDLLVSPELFEKRFVCELTSCKGACCVEGDSGAPLTYDEIDQLEDALDAISPFMEEEGREMIEKAGVFYMDIENEPVTTLIHGKRCAFVYFDEHQIAKCSIEKAFREGKTIVQKPLSCHLYPIRIKSYYGKKVLTYNEWSICSPACQLGNSLGVPVFRFLKDSLIRAFGEPFYEELEKVYIVWEDKKNRPNI